MTPETTKLRNRYPQEMSLMSGCPHCGAETNREFVEATIDDILKADRQALLDAVMTSLEAMPAFTCCSDKCMGKVSDEAKKPAYGTNYLERETVLNLLKGVLHNN